MLTIYDAEGNEIGKLALSEKQQATLDASGKLSVLYRTPQLMQGELGRRNGSFMLYKKDDRVVALTSASAKEFFELQAAIAAFRGAS
jgi:hypothetical protein